MPFSLFHHSGGGMGDSFCVVAALSSGVRWVREECFLQLEETIDLADGM